MTLENYIKYKLGVENVDFVRKFKKPLNTLCKITVPDLTNVSYQNVKHVIPDLIENDNYELAILIVLQSVSKSIILRKVKRSNVRSRLLFVFWIQKQYELIGQLESERLQSSPSAAMINAGINNLNVLGDINLIDTLAEGNVLKWDEVRALPYGKVFEKQLKNHLMNKITENLEKNRKR